MNQSCEELLDDAAALIHETIRLLNRSKLSDNLQAHYSSSETLITAPEYDVKQLLLKLEGWSRRY
jgi:ribonuclease BN (tRNA processing enzyme)